ncbi:MAG: diguanylate cyclase domain-containing protein [Candidatus Acidiferrales bacterium]
MAYSFDASRPRTSGEDSFLDLLIETLENLDKPVRGQFLQKFFKSIAQVDLTESISLECWEKILLRRQELSESLAKPISLKTVIVDVLADTNYLRMPILMEYEELKKLQINAATDALTGLYNRRLFEEYFNKELNRAKRYGQHLAVVIMDLHRFKDINDKYGHLAGDQALQSAASTMRKTLRTSDYAFRIGGDEFALLLPQSDPEQAATLCRRLRSSYAAATEPMKLDVALALDFGIAVFPEDGDQQEGLLRLADERLYQLKNSGRNHLAPPPPPAPEVHSPAPPPPAASPRVVAMESPVVKPLVAALNAGAQEAGAPHASRPAAGTAAQPPPGSEMRKWERVSLAGTKAYAVLSTHPERSARVLDLSYGGVALLMDPSIAPSGNFHAVLHVPILPPVKVQLRKVYEFQDTNQQLRMGCAFVS